MTPEPLTVYDEIRHERVRAVTIHALTSIEYTRVGDPRRLAVLVEEVGEVARVLNEWRHEGGGIDFASLRVELIQVAAVAAAWADNIGWQTAQQQPDTAPPDPT